MSTAGHGGAIGSIWCRTHYADALAALPPDLAEDEVLHPDLLLYDDGRLTVHPTPFDYVNPDAKVLLVCLIPGCQEHHLAVTTVATQLRAGATLEQALQAADKAASFAGATRDPPGPHVRRHRPPRRPWPGHHRDLFGPRADLASSISAICHCVQRDSRSTTSAGPRHRHLGCTSPMTRRINLEKTGPAKTTPTSHGHSIAAPSCG